MKKPTAGSRNELPQPRRDLHANPGHWLITLCVFLSGLCALVYQMTWLREFRLVFGASTAASAAVLAIFMGGIGAGGLILGRRVDRQPNPFRYYGQLELIIALAAALSPLLLWVARQAYLALGGTWVLGIAAGTALRLGLAALVLLVPTFLMGGTLPAMVNAVRAEGDERRRMVALLYGANTLGGVVGALLSTFVLFERLGNRGTLWSAAIVNVVLALIVLPMARRFGAPNSTRKTGQSSPQETSPHSTPAGAGNSAPVAPAAFVFSAAAGVGFAFFVMELVWYRMLGPLLGGSTFTFGLILAIALLGIALGSLLYCVWRGRGPVSLAGFAAVCALEALFIAVPYALGDRLALLAIALQPLGSFGFAMRVADWSLVAFIVVFPPALLAGFQFPMLIALLGQRRGSVGAHTGQAYGWNTAGAIAGSLAGGFGLLPALTAPGVWRLMVLLLVALALAALGLVWRSQRRFLPSLPALATSAAALLLLTAIGPTAAWRHSPIGAGRVQMNAASWNDHQRFLQSRRGLLRWEAEGVESSLGLVSDDGLAFYVNGKSDGHARNDAPMQVMSGLLAALIHPEPHRSLVVGLGTGSTAGWLGDVPTMERVEVVELEPAIVQVARDCAPVNRHVLDNPKVHLWFGDAREALLTCREQYDLIASEPSNPYRAGVASLFTREFYQASARRLRPGGLFVQWVQAYEVDGATVGTIYATLASVFPAIEIWQAGRSDLVFVAAAQPITYDVPAMRRRLGEEPFRTAVASVWRMTDLEGVFARYVAHRDLASALPHAAIPLCTDDRNVLEFAFARTVGRDTGFNIESLRKLAREQGYVRPDLKGGALDSDKVLDRRASTLVVNQQTDLTIAGDDPGFRARAQAKIAFGKGDPTTALASWQRQSQEPADLIELTLVAAGLACRGDDQALRYVEQLRHWVPVEADALRAQYHWSRGELREGFDAALQSFFAFRTDPWPQSAVMESTLNLGLLMAKQPGQTAQVERLLQALQPPFAVELLGEARLRARLDLAGQLDQLRGTHLTRDVLAEREPTVPWTRSWLQLRANSYVQANDGRAGNATRDLAKFDAHEGRPLVLMQRKETLPIPDLEKTVTALVSRNTGGAPTQEK